jgi:very-short-patch-repair endonuclease
MGFCVIGSDQIGRIAEHGDRVIRFWNNEGIDNLDGVLETIRRDLAPAAPASP